MAFEAKRAAGRVFGVFGILAAVSAVHAVDKADLSDSGAEPARNDGSQTTGVRLVDGVPVPPFGEAFTPKDDTEFSRIENLVRSRLKSWPDASAAPAGEMPLLYGKWTRGPYRNPSGERWVAQINAWYQEGSAAGLTQDTFRSFDNGHSSIRLRAYPQMKHEKPVESLRNLEKVVFLPRVTMGVQSYGREGESVIEWRSRQTLRSFYAQEDSVAPFLRSYRLCYESNFLFVAPAVGSFTHDKDAFAFLSPFYLHSVGASGSDSRLLKPLVFASAALPPDLKTRMLRKGLFVPTLMYLFKSTITGDIRSPGAHLPAYALPAESESDSEAPTPFLHALLNSAHDLTHIPPVARLGLKRVSIEAEGDRDYGGKAYYEENIYAFNGALRPGQAFDLTVDLRYSWTDEGRPIVGYHTSVLRGEASVEFLNEEQSVLNIRIPWLLTNNKDDLRTDVLFVVNDGTYDSAPAYLSVRHLHRLDPITLGIRTR